VEVSDHADHGSPDFCVFGERDVFVEGVDAFEVELLVSFREFFDHDAVSRDAHGHDGPGEGRGFRVHDGVVAFIEEGFHGVSGDLHREERGFLFALHWGQPEEHELSRVLKGGRASSSLYHGEAVGADFGSVLRGFGVVRPLFFWCTPGFQQVVYVFFCESVSLKQSEHSFGGDMSYIPLAGFNHGDIGLVHPCTIPYI